MKETEIEDEKMNVGKQKTAENNSETQDEQPSADEQATIETEQEADAAEDTNPLEAANKQLEEMKDKYLRSVAEFDNYRKRTLKEKTELILNGGEKAIIALLPILDDMERAMLNAEKTDDPQVLKEGMELIYAKFQKSLEALGVKKIDTADADFDTDVHEAIAMVPGMGDDKKGKVLDCVQNGYKLNDKVIRHAKVAVGQ